MYKNLFDLNILLCKRKKQQKKQQRICSLDVSAILIPDMAYSVSLTDCIEKLYAIFFVWQHSFMCLLICVARRRIINNEKVGYTFYVSHSALGYVSDLCQVM